MRSISFLGTSSLDQGAVRHMTFAFAFAFAFCASTGALASSHAEEVVRGRYLATVGDCTACHTKSGGKPFAGGVAFRTPFGVIYSPNITPDARTGIGRWTDAQFLRAMHEGIGPRGQNYYPAFPYVEFSRVSTPDVLAIRAYLASLPAVSQLNHVDALPFPYGFRPALKVWNLFNFKHAAASPIAEHSTQFVRGRYFVEGLAHCGECHTSRNLLQGLASHRLGGGMVDGWTAYNITPDPISGIGGWPRADIERYLATGHVDGKAQAAGPMADAVTHSLSHLRPDDLAAIALYLKGLPPIRTPGVNRSRFDQGTPDPDRTSFRPSSSGAFDGRALYVANCASCHGLDGGGVPARGGVTSYPSLFRNSAVGGSDANNLILAILNGVRRSGADGPVLMPAFDSASSISNPLDDGEVAAIANYVTSRFGDPSAHVEAAKVATLRAGVVKPVLLNRLVTAGLLIGAVVGLGLFGLVALFVGKRIRSAATFRSAAR